MKKGRCLLFFLLNAGLFVQLASGAPLNYTWEFYSTLKTPTAKQLETLLSTHKLGKNVAYFYEAFLQTYVVKEAVVPGDPTLRTVIRKPDIYKAVRSIEKELSHEVKDNKQREVEARDTMIRVLKVALAASDSDTTSFEEALHRHRKDVPGLLEVFGEVNLKSLY